MTNNFEYFYHDSIIYLVIVSSFNHLLEHIWMMIEKYIYNIFCRWSSSSSESYVLMCCCRHTQNSTNGAILNHCSYIFSPVCVDVCVCVYFCPTICVFCHSLPIPHIYRCHFFTHKPCGNASRMLQMALLVVLQWISVYLSHSFSSILPLCSVLVFFLNNVFAPI